MGWNPFKKIKKLVKKVGKAAGSVLKGTAKFAGSVLKTSAAVALGTIQSQIPTAYGGGGQYGAGDVVIAHAPAGTVTKNDTIAGLPKPLIYAGAAIAAIAILKK